ncbi:vomeronasal type-2 receptor 26-like [Aquarana catesbeiana]|uniref:vomeronasal type-2 receptor 26-like n=1 Tax=Aquarana catesbeiana TaxID=8400 RepID=UPI003CCA5422
MAGAEPLSVPLVERVLRCSMPEGRCCEHCTPGTRKAVTGFHSCCYNCIFCSEEEISNLSGLFYYFLDTPIVKANNRSLSFIILISLKFSLLSVFLFIGRPVDITCMLRQISFGILFSVAVSSVLAKTIMVCIAFKATRPGSTWKKWVGVKLPNAVVLICSSIQALNGIIWLAFFTPYPEFDMDSYPGKIIIQCNEGSVLAFYFLFFYIGFLATVNFVLAFLVRTLPDVFNEAKYITFSMLVFCSVWICAVPAYLSSAARSGGFEGNANHDSLGQDRRYSNREQDSKEDLAQHAGDIYWTSNEQENREQAKLKGDEDDEAEAAIIGFNNGSVQKIVK